MKKIKKAAKLLEQIKGDDYYIGQAKLCDSLREFIRFNNILELSKADLIELCCLVSRHRPMQPWQFLLEISIQRDKVNE